ncbi:ROK family transcriptional regulator [Lacticigenium naphthae]|uniref:ROK family transcriptional regulator n=1 Tax=Lacticigenium naphthae TaxID=515351 RepID=UPI0003FFE44D|nr:ROK family transcriptional regulator [Lacticigenium naphthae]
MDRGTFEMMKLANKRLILNSIRLNGPISRAKIAKQTKITPPTVSKIVKELIEEELVKESHLGESEGGRKPTLLLLKEDGYFVVSVDASSTHLRVMISNLVGEILIKKEISQSSSLSKEKFLKELVKKIREIIKTSAVDSEKILGIGVAMHGVVDIEQGTCLFSSDSGLKNIPIKESLEKELNLPVMVENNSRAMALGEFWFGKNKKGDSFSVINIGRGVGSGIITDGTLSRGAHDTAGEIGHTTISMHGRQCGCGNKGCLETYITGEGIVKTAREEIENIPSDISPEKIYQLAKQGETEYIQVLEKVGEYIGVGIVNYIHTVDPEVIVLGGGVLKSQEFLMPIIKKTITEKALTDKLKKGINLYVSDLGENMTLLGASVLFLKKLFH